MYAFSYHRPTNIRTAASLLSKAEDAKLLAGGHTLLPTMKLRLASPQNLVDLAAVEGLAGIEVKGRAGMIGDPAVRARGTIGGSIANNDPAADYPAACLALGATIVTNKRKIAADDFFTGLFDTALEDGELIIK